MAFNPIKLFAGRPDVKPYNKNSRDLSNFIYYHGSDHKFEPGDIINPTTSIYQSSKNYGDDEQEAKEFDKAPYAWSSNNPNFFKKYATYMYEVEPLSRHSTIVHDPVGLNDEEFAASEGYRVRQMIWDKKKDSCSKCDGEGTFSKGNRYPYPICTDCFGTGLSTSKIAGLQKTGLSLEEIKKYRPGW